MIVSPVPDYRVGLNRFRNAAIADQIYYTIHQLQGAELAPYSTVTLMA